MSRMASSNSLDSLYAQVARRVLTKSLSVKKGESLVVETWNNGLPFARHVIVEARRIGAVVVTLFEDEEAYIQGVEEGDPDEVGVMGKPERALISSADAYVFIPGPPIGALSRKLPRKDVSLSTRYNNSWYELAAKRKLRGVRLPFGYIDDETAKALGKPARSIVTSQLKAALTDFDSLGSRAREIAAHLGDGAVMKLVTPGAELTFTLSGESEINDGVVDEKDLETQDNVAYIPPGYVYKQIDPKSVSGALSISRMVNLLGSVEDGLIRFEEGRVVGWSSRSSKSTLNKIMEAIPEQSRSATGLIIGLNPDLKYGYGQNTLVAGVVALRCPGLTIATKAGTLMSGRKTLVRKGHLV